MAMNEHRSLNNCRAAIGDVLYNRRNRDSTIEALQIGRRRQEDFKALLEKNMYRNLISKALTSYVTLFGGVLYFPMQSRPAINGK